MDSGDSDRTAFLLMDLQKDFLGAEARMPVDREAVPQIIRTANEVLGRPISETLIPILIVNEFPRSDRIGNYFRKGAAIQGTPGAELDPRLAFTTAIRRFSKTKSSAFSNPELDPFLRAKRVSRLYVFGVFAEGCVRATVLDALRLGYKVSLIEEAIASNAQWKKRFALRVMRRAGAEVIPALDPSKGVAPRV